MISVRKRNHHGQVTWEYSGHVLEKGDDFITLEARFNRDDMPFQGIILKRDDRFVETFYTQQGYNIFEIHDRDDDSIKGWYCNIGHPMVWDEPQVISYIDLYLDLWITPDGLQSVLDEDEFEEAALDEKTRAQALHALRELISIFNAKQPG
jgi:predicted RNA-binding protein associated with RNAse of E/G family